MKCVFRQVALIGKYHAATAPGGRQHRLIVALHPSITRHDGSATPLTSPQLGNTHQQED